MVSKAVTITEPDDGSGLETLDEYPLPPDGVPLTTSGTVPNRKGLETRRRLLQETERLCVSTAYHQVTVAEIARGSNSSPATFYHYFTDVAAATAEVAEAHFRQLEPVTELARRLQTLPVTEERSREFVVALMDFWKGRGGLLEALIIADSGADPRFFRVLNRSASEVSAALAPLVNGAPQIGTAGALVMMICHATAREQGFAIGGVSREELVQSLSQIVFRTLSVGSDRPGDRG